MSEKVQQPKERTYVVRYEMKYSLGGSELRGYSPELTEEEVAPWVLKQGLLAYVLFEYKGSFTRSKDFGVASE